MPGGLPAARQNASCPGRGQTVRDQGMPPLAPKEPNDYGNGTPPRRLRRLRGDIHAHPFEISHFPVGDGHHSPVRPGALRLAADRRARPGTGPGSGHGPGKKRLQGTRADRGHAERSQRRHPGPARNLPVADRARSRAVAAGPSRRTARRPRGPGQGIRQPGFSSGTAHGPARHGRARHVRRPGLPPGPGSHPRGGSAADARAIRHAALLQHAV